MSLSFLEMDTKILICFSPILIIFILKVIIATLVWWCVIKKEEQRARDKHSSAQKINIEDTVTSDSENNRMASGNDYEMPNLVPKPASLLPISNLQRAKSVSHLPQAKLPVQGDPSSHEYFKIAECTANKKTITKKQNNEIPSNPDYLNLPAVTKR